MSEQERPGFLAVIAATFSAAYHAVMEGGEIQAAVRQGFREIGNALEPFPNQISVAEPGSLSNPLYSDLAADMSHHAQAKEAAMENALPSPSELLRDSRGYRQPAENAQEHGNEM